MQSLSEVESKNEEGREGPHGFIVLETNYHLYAYTSKEIMATIVHTDLVLQIIRYRLLC